MNDEAYIVFDSARRSGATADPYLGEKRHLRHTLDFLALTTLDDVFSTLSSCKIPLSIHGTWFNEFCI